MKRYTSTILLCTMVITGFMMLGAPVMAKKSATDARGFLRTTVGKTGISERDPIEVSATVIKAALALVGVIFLILMVYGGFTWMLARGNEELVNKARDTVKAAAIGLVIIVAAYSIANFITDLVQRGARTGTPNSSAINELK